MILNDWPFVALSILAVGLTPGPSMLFGFAISAQFGFGRSLYAGAGVLTALSVYSVLSLSGLGALLLAAPWAVALLQWFGVLYLGWLGVQAIFRYIDFKTVHKPNDLHKKTLDTGSLYIQGLITGITNPKAILFFSAIFPLFLDSNFPFALQGLLLYSTFSVCWAIAFISYAASGAILKNSTSGSVNNRRLSLFTGLIYLSAASMLAFRR